MTRGHLSISFITMKNYFSLRRQMVKYCEICNSIKFKIKNKYEHVPTQQHLPTRRLFVPSGTYLHDVYLYLVAPTYTTSICTQQHLSTRRQVVPSSTYLHDVSLYLIAPIYTSSTYLCLVAPIYMTSTYQYLVAPIYMASICLQFQFHKKNNCQKLHR